MTPTKITTETIYFYGNEISIIFRNAVFYKAIYPFRGMCSRVEWSKLAAIESEITRIEESLKTNQPLPSLDENGTGFLVTPSFSVTPCNVRGEKLNSCFDGLPALLAINQSDPAWREYLDDEMLVEGDFIYALTHRDWSTVMGLAGRKYKSIKDYHKAFTTRPLPVEKKVQS